MNGNRDRSTRNLARILTLVFAVWGIGCADSSAAAKVGAGVANVVRKTGSKTARKPKNTEKKGTNYVQVNDPDREKEAAVAWEKSKGDPDAYGDYWENNCSAMKGWVWSWDADGCIKVSTPT